eukprot:scaffold1019_cov255-Pinguiococcus_pyrenoidosus.AAC.24
MRRRRRRRRARRRRATRPRRATRTKKDPMERAEETTMYKVRHAEQEASAQGFCGQRHLSFSALSTEHSPSDAETLEIFTDEDRLYYISDDASDDEELDAKEEHFEEGRRSPKAWETGGDLTWCDSDNEEASAAPSTPPRKHAGEKRVIYDISASEGRTAASPAESLCELRTARPKVIDLTLDETPPRDANGS